MPKATSTPAKKPTRRQAARDEYKAALADLNRYSDNNETPAALKARQRFEKADRARSGWWPF